MSALKNARFLLRPVVRYPAQLHALMMFDKEYSIAGKTYEGRPGGFTMEEIEAGALGSYKVKGGTQIYKVKIDMKTKDERGFHRRYLQTRHDTVWTATSVTAKAPNPCDAHYLSLWENVGGTVTMVGQSNTSSFADASLSTVSLTASADNVNKALKLKKEFKQLMILILKLKLNKLNIIKKK